MNSRTVLKSSVFNSSKENVFRLLKALKTLKYISSPFADFTTVSGEENVLWKAGEEIDLNLKLFYLIPMGVHKIKVIEFSEDRIYTNESNPNVLIWNHKITLEEIEENKVKYTDEVEINAGWKTIFVYVWAKFFYGHRQRKWRKLLNFQ